MLVPDVWQYTPCYIRYVLLPEVDSTGGYSGLRNISITTEWIFMKSDTRKFYKISGDIRISLKIGQQQGDLMETNKRFLVGKETGWGIPKGNTCMENPHQPSAITWGILRDDIAGTGIRHSAHASSH
jgi:hypothetical protein